MKPTPDPRSATGSPEANGHGPEDNPFDNPSAREKRAKQQADTAATEDRKNRWKPYWFAVASLEGLRYDWARKLAWAVDHKDAMRDPITDLPTLLFRGVDAVEAGANDEHLAMLPRLQPSDIADLKRRAAAMRQDSRKQVDSLAHAMAISRETTVAAPEPLDLSALLAEPDEDTAYRIAELWPIAGRVLLAAQYKSGKSTLVGNVIRSLVDGDQFLGKFNVAAVRKVVLIDTELDRGTLRRWLRDQGIRNTSAVTVAHLRGAISTFDILAAAVRSQWAQRFAGADVVILDCLRPVIDVLGLSEDKDAGRVLVAFDALLAEIGAQEGLVVTHMGHQNERARGDSRLLDWPDALWKIVRGGEDADESRPLFLSALGRDVEVPEGQLTFDRATRHLSYANGSRTESRKVDVIEKRLTAILDALADARAEGDSDGLNTTAIKTAVDGRKDVTDKALALGVQRGLLMLRYAGRSKIYTLDPKALDPLFSGGESGVANARLAPVLELRRSDDSAPTAP